MKSCKLTDEQANMVRKAKQRAVAAQRELDLIVAALTVGKIEGPVTLEGNELIEQDAPQEST